MSIPRPRVVTPSLPRLSAALQELGLPPVVRCDPLAPPWVHANYRLAFEPGSGTPDLLLRRRLTDPGHDTFGHELAALTALRASDLPVVRSYRVLPRGTLPWPAVLSDLLPGGQGFRLIRKLPEHASAICQSVGGLVRRLEHEIRPTWATDVDGDRFVPRRASWREEWADHCWGWWRRARQAGTDLGPLGQDVFDALEARLPVLDSADHWCVVHGDLHPSNLLFEPPAEGEGPPLSGIVDWEGAVVGDPLLEWALLVELPDATLGHVLTGIGEERVREVLDDPDALARLEVYRHGRAIRRLAFGAMSLFRGDGGGRRSYALEYARVVCRETLERPLSEKLAAALACGTEGDVIQKVPAPPAHRVIWQGVESLRFRPALPAADHALHLCGALAGVLCDVRHQGLATELARRISPQAYRELGAPITDRVGAIDQLVERVIERPDRPMALAAVALVTEALGRLAPNPARWPVGDDVLIGLDVLVRKLHAGEPPHEPAAGKLAREIIGLAAYQALAEQRETREAQLAAIDRVRLAWEDLTLFGSAPTGSIALAEVRERWVDAPDFDRPLVPVLLWALERTADGLPGDRARVLGALGLEPSDDEAAE